MKETKLDRHVFCFNPTDNGGESLILTTDIIANGDRGVVFLNQELSLQSYCNSASFELVGATIYPDMLRKLANELESRMVAAEVKATQLYDAEKESNVVAATK